LRKISAQTGNAPTAGPPALSLLSQWALAGTAVFAFLWVVGRAAVQSITIDEAATYLNYVGRPGPAYWLAEANNHVLNSMLMRLATLLFGVSGFTVRLPAMVGAAIYISSALALANLLPAGRWLRWCLLVSLTCNPFVMDFLVAARGYSLALGFLLALIALAARPVDARAGAVYSRLVLCSLCAGLSFAANFSFALADATVLLLCGFWLLWRVRPAADDSRLERTGYARLAAASVLPGAAVALLLTEPVLRHWTRSNFIFGTTSLAQTIRSVITSSLYRPNQHLLGPGIYRVFVWCGPCVFAVVGIACVLRLASFALLRPGSATENRFAVQLAWLAGSSVVLLLGLHRLLYRLTHIYMPLERTAVFFAPLAVLFAAALAATPASSRLARAARRLLLAAVTAMSLYFLGCLRLRYFRDWAFDADVKHVYSILASYNRTYGLTDICSNWRYADSLNFYRAAGWEPIPAIASKPWIDADYPPGRQIYVVFQPFAQPFIEREHLTVVYNDAESGVAVAVPADFLTRPRRP
jgi:hypothetical protein